MSRQQQLSSALASLRHGLARFEAAVDTLDLSLSDAVAAQLDADSRFPAPVLPDVKPAPPVKPPRPPALTQQKSLFEALKRILLKMPSPYAGVASIYDEIRAFIAICMLQAPQIQPTAILNDNLFPYLIAAHRLQPSLRDRICLQMQMATGCSEADFRRILKRIVDNHHRGFKRKPPVRHAIPQSMQPLIGVLGGDAYPSLNLLVLEASLSDNDGDLELRSKRPRLTSPPSPLI